MSSSCLYQQVSLRTQFDPSSKARANFFRCIPLVASSCIDRNVKSARIVFLAPRSDRWCVGRQHRLAGTVRLIVHDPGGIRLAWRNRSGRIGGVVCKSTAAGLPMPGLGFSAGSERLLCLLSQRRRLFTKQTSIPSISGLNSLH